MSKVSYTSPEFLPYTAGVVWNDVGMVNINFLGWSDVSLEWRYLDNVLFPSEVNVCNSLDTWHEVKLQDWVRTYIHHLSFESSCSIVDFDFEA